MSSCLQGRVTVAIPTRGRLDPAICLNTWEEMSADVETIIFLDANVPPGFARALSASGLRQVQLRSSGYASVRNEILEWAIDQSDFLIFFDDDQMPGPGWLDALLRPLDDPPIRRPHVVFGPVIGIPLGMARLHAEDIRYAYSPGAENDSFVEMAYSGNTLIDLGHLAQLGIQFDTRFDHIGGEDTDFFQRFSRQGGRILFTARAVALEWIDPSRRSLVSRYRAGITSARRKRTLGCSRPTRIASVLASSARAGLCLLRGAAAIDPHLIGLGLFWVGRVVGFASRLDSAP